MDGFTCLRFLQILKKKNKNYKLSEHIKYLRIFLDGFRSFGSWNLSSKIHGTTETPPDDASQIAAWGYQEDVPSDEHGGKDLVDMAESWGFPIDGWLMVDNGG